MGCAIANGARRTDDCRVPGLSVETMVLLSRALGFRYRTIWVQTHTELEALILNGTADFSLSYAGITADLWSKVIFLEPLNFLELGFMVRVPRRQVNGVPILSPFQLHTWVCLLAVFLVTAFLLTLQQTSLRAAPDTMFRLYSFVVGQHHLRIHWKDGKWRPKVSFNILTTHFAILVLIVETLYSCVTVAFLCPGRAVVPFRDTGSLAQLVETGEKTLYTASKDTFYFNQVLNSTAEGHVRMKKAIAENPLKYFVSNDKTSIVDALQKDRSLVAPLTSFSFGTQARYADSTIKFIKDESLAGSYESIIVRPNFPHVRLFQEALTGGLKETIHEIAKRDYYHRDDGIPLGAGGKLKEEAKLVYLASLFYFWIGGLAASCLAFFAEVVYNRFMAEV